MSLAAEIGSNHLLCNIHFRRSLKVSEFSYQVSELASAKCEIDFDLLRKHYAEEFSKYIGTRKMIDINKALMSCGLQFEETKKEITILDDVLWEHVSLIKREKYKMPTTTNALESTHGHLNAKTPRHNDFYTALDRLAKYIHMKTLGFENAYKVNLRRAKRIIKRKCIPINHELIEKESLQYETTKNSCKCGETKLLSSMMLVDLPCSHRVTLGASFPTKPDNVILRIKNSIDSLSKEFIIEERESTQNAKDYNAHINENAARTIRKFSKFKKIAKIAEDITPIKIQDEVHFANGRPLGFYTSVSQGIHKYHDFKKEKNMMSSSNSDVSSVEE